jgi:hypothetical protein
MSPARKPKNTEEAEELLQTKPLVVLFYLDGCPHCEANKPAWEDFKKSCKLPVAEIESNETPSSSGVTGFPTMMHIKKDGSKKTIEGKRGTYTLEPPDDAKPKLLATLTIAHPQWLKEGDQIVGLSEGKPVSLSAKGTYTLRAFRAQHDSQRVVRCLRLYQSPAGQSEGRRSRRPARAPHTFCGTKISSMMGSSALRWAGDTALLSTRCR